jgi:hypothetical protein
MGMCPCGHESSSSASQVSVVRDCVPACLWIVTVCVLMGHGCVLSWDDVCQGLHPQHPGSVLSFKGVVGLHLCESSGAS